MMKSVNSKKTYIYLILMLLILVAVTFFSLNAIQDNSIRPSQGSSSNEAPSSYQIIYPYNLDENSYEYCAATLLQYYIKNKTGVEMPITTSQTSSNCIYVGFTTNNVSEIKNNPDFRAFFENSDVDEYYISTTPGCIFLSGEKYLIGAAVSEFAENCVTLNGDILCDDYKNGKLKTFQPGETPKNVIYFISDGAGPNHFKWYDSTISPNHFSGNDMPYQGYLRTDCSTGETTDSAASGTALACGFKTVNGIIGMDIDAAISYKNIREALFEKGFMSAVFTTDDITGATPACFTAHSSSRNNTDDIATQQLELYNNREINYIRGSLNDTNYMQTLSGTLNEFSQSNDNFFVMYEEAYTDKCSHSNDSEGMLAAAARYDQVLKYSMVFAAANPDTTIIATSDHETGGITYSEDKGFAYTRTDHSSADVRIMGMGPAAEYFDGKALENCYVPIVLADAFQIDDIGDTEKYPL